MTSAREPAVAGSFYPADPSALQSLLGDLLSTCESPSLPPPKALIVPHAGYPYSGPVAASAYAALPRVAAQITRVVLLGPAHRKVIHGIAVPTVQAFNTPLGAVPLDQTAIARALTLPTVHYDDAAHRLEHSLEVQLPFLQHQLGDFTLLPLLVGELSARAVADVIELFWGGPDTLFIISSDLSHYLDYRTAQAQDANTSRAIEALAWEDIGYHDACGRNPVNGLLLYAREHGLSLQTLDLRNSGDTAGSCDRVVGYGAYLLTEPHAV